MSRSRLPAALRSTAVINAALGAVSPGLSGARRCFNVFVAANVLL
jgi:hypothetical protein